MPDIEPPSPANLAPAPSITGGASVQPVYATRMIPVIAIQEDELTTLSALNAGATTLIGVASFFTSSAIGIYTNSVFATELTAEGKLATKYVAPVMLGVSVLCACFAIFLIFKKRSLVSGIKSQSKTS